jgi:hypothetical protein
VQDGRSEPRIESMTAAIACWHWRLTYLPNGRGSARCSVFHPTDPAFEPSLCQHQSPEPGNAILRDRDKGLQSPPPNPINRLQRQMRARIPVVRGLFALNEEISVLTRLCGGAGRTRTSNQTIISRYIVVVGFYLARNAACVMPRIRSMIHPKGDSLLAATKTRKGASDHVRLQPPTRQVPSRSCG